MSGSAPEARAAPVMDSAVPAISASEFVWKAVIEPSSAHWSSTTTRTVDVAT